MHMLEEQIWRIQTKKALIEKGIMPQDKWIQDLEFLEASINGWMHK